jgi:hypothetical protein
MSNVPRKGPPSLSKKHAFVSRADGISQKQYDIYTIEKQHFTLYQQTLFCELTLSKLS